MKHLWLPYLLISVSLALFWDVLLFCVLVGFKVPHLFSLLLLIFSLIAPVCFIALAICSVGSSKL